MSGSPYAFIADFDSGSHITSLMACLKIVNREGAFCIDKDGIYFRQPNSTNSIVNEFVIYGGALAPCYMYNFSSNKILLGLSIFELKAIINCTSKYGVRLVLFKYIPNDSMNIGIETLSDKVCIQKYETAKKTQAEANIDKIQRKQLTDTQASYFQTPIHFDINRKFACEIPVSKFKDDLGTIFTSKSKYITLIGYPNGLVINYSRDGESVDGKREYGSIPTEPLVVQSSGMFNIPDIPSFDFSSIPHYTPTPTIIDDTIPNNNEILEIKVEMQAIKAMKKYNGIGNKESVVRVFVDPINRYIEFSIEIGPGIGFLMTYLRDVQQQQDSMVQSTLQYNPYTSSITQTAIPNSHFPTPSPAFSSPSFSQTPNFTPSLTPTQSFIPSFTPGQSF